MKNFTAISLGLLILTTSTAFADLSAQMDLQTASNGFITPHIDNPGLLQNGYYDSGLILGKLKDVDVVGDYLETWETTFAFGDIDKQDKQEKKKENSSHFCSETLKCEGKKPTQADFKNKYKTASYQLSVAQEDIFLGLRGLDKKQPYILKYQKSVLPQTLSRNTPFTIVDAYPTYIGMDPRSAGIPLEFTEQNLLVNQYTSDVATGRLIKVQRWGALSTGCTLTLHMKGAKSVVRRTPEIHFTPGMGFDLMKVMATPASAKPVAAAPVADAGNPNANANAKAASPSFTSQLRNAFSFGPKWDLKLKTTDKLAMNVLKMAINSDEGCRYVEDLLPFGATIDVTFTPTYNNIVNYSRVVSKIRVQTPNQPKQIEPAHSSKQVQELIQYPSKDVYLVN